jgi:hypothetical protein
LLPASVNIIIAQRLIRKLCPHCKKEVKFNELGEQTIANIKNAISLTPKEELLERV